ncbi:MAG: hypothetical protein IPP17_25105, partial [Bacteroidetes bacterium]|nr:hypothetical protein [Bacteroidota bacterium]
AEVYISHFADITHDRAWDVVYPGVEPQWQQNDPASNRRMRTWQIGCRYSIDHPARQSACFAGVIKIKSVDQPVAAPCWGRFETLDMGGREFHLAHLWGGYGLEDYAGGQSIACESQ